MRFFVSTFKYLILDSTFLRQNICLRDVAIQVRVAQKTNSKGLKGHMVDALIDVWEHFWGWLENGQYRVLKLAILILVGGILFEALKAVATIIVIIALMVVIVFMLGVVLSASGYRIPFIDNLWREDES